MIHTRKEYSGMRKHMCILPVFLVAAIALIFGAAPNCLAVEEEEFEEASIYFELNDTDGDLGIHALVDGDAWKYLEIEDPRGRKMLNIIVGGRLRLQGLTEIFFESAEPTFDELPPKQFFRRFPEGTYEIEGITLEGEELESEVELTHMMPAPPQNIKINNDDAAENCDADELPSVDAGKPVSISWDPVTESHPNIGKSGVIVVDKYQVVVEFKEEESERVFEFIVDLPAPGNGTERLEVTVPAEFFESFKDLEGEFKFEILVREESGNQTAVESCFEVDYK